MQFVNLGLLPYFLPLVAIPIILHLLTLHRLKTVELSTFRFLFDSYVQQRRKMKFLEALLAMLRTLFLLLLVLSIARPVVKHWGQMFVGSSASQDVVFLIDGSASMGAVTDGTTALQRAQQAAGEVLERLSAEDRVTIIRVGAKPREICSRFSSDAEEVRSGLDALKVTPSRANLFAALSQVFGPESKLNQPVVYLFSDLQASGWSEFEKGQTDGLVPPDTEVVVVDVGSQKELPNRAVMGGADNREQAIVGLPLKLRPRVANYSLNETQDVEVQVFVDDQEVARESMTLKPGDTRDVEILYTPEKAGTLRGRYQIGPDRFTDDDTFLFTVSVAPRVKVVLVNGKPTSEPLDNEGLYLRTAMMATEAGEGFEPNDEEATLSDAERAAQQRLVRSLDVVDLPQAVLKSETLEDADVVVLANCGGLNASQHQMLCQFVAGGGGLLVFPGDLVKVDAYNKILFSAPATPEETLLSATLGAMSGDTEKADTYARFDPDATDFAHPVLSVFADPSQKYFGKVSIYRRFEIQLPDNSQNTSPLVRFVGGQPAIVESRYGEGRVLLSAFPCNTKWGNLPLKREFVPLVVRMIEYVKRLPDVTGPSVVAADGEAEFVVDGAWSPATGSVSDKTGRVTPVMLERSNSRLKGAFDGTTEKGYYTVVVKGGRAEQPKEASIAFAVNLAAGESNFKTQTKPQVKNLLPSAKITFVDSSAEARQKYGSAGNEREIWRVLLTILFVIIGVEFMLSTGSGGRSEEREGPTAGQRLRELVSADQEFVEST